MEQVYKQWKDEKKKKKISVVLKDTSHGIMMVVIYCYLKKKIAKFSNFLWIISVTLK